MEVLDYWRAIRRRWYLVVIVAVLSGAIGWVTAPDPVEVEATQTFRATETLYREGGASGPSLETMALLATTGEVPRRVAQEIAPGVQPQLLAQQVEVQANPDLGTLTFTARGEDGERAAEVAHAFAEETLTYFDARSQFRQQTLLERLDERVNELEEQIQELDQRLAGLPEGSSEATLVRSERDALIRQHGFAVEQLHETASTTAGTTNLVTLEEAVPVPEATEGFQAPSSSLARGLIGLLLGALLGIGLVVFLDRVDSRIRSREAAQSAFRLPVIGEIPRIPVWWRRGKGIVTVERPASFIAESFRFLRLAVQTGDRWIPSITTPGEGLWSPIAAERVEDDDHPVRTVLVTSPGAREGKSTTVANVAASFAEAGKRVLVVDLDFRHPEQHKYFRVSDEPGMSDYLGRDEDAPSLRSLVQETDIPGVKAIPVGTETENPGQLRAAGAEFIRAVRELADVVLIDTGPVLSVNEPVALAPFVDAVLVVARATGTHFDAAVRTTDLLARHNAPVVGVALVGVAKRESGQPYYYAQVRSVPADRSGFLRGRLRASERDRQSA